MTLKTVTTKCIFFKNALSIFLLPEWHKERQLVGKTLTTFSCEILGGMLNLKNRLIKQLLEIYLYSAILSLINIDLNIFWALKSYHLLQEQNHHLLNLRAADLELVPAGNKLTAFINICISASDQLSLLSREPVLLLLLWPALWACSSCWRFSFSSCSFSSFTWC